MSPHAPAPGRLLDALQGVTWPARRTVRGSMHGQHHARLRGVAPEFSEYRLYRQGDDLRRLDWKLLARTERPFLRLADDRATLPTLIVVDASASMDWPEADGNKWHVATAVAVGLASAAYTGNDPVGLTIAAPDPIRVPPRTRRGIVGEIERALTGTTPAGAPPMIPRGDATPWPARVAVISDFLQRDESLHTRAAEHVAAGGEVHAVHVVTREELDPRGGAILAVDPEQPEVRRALTREVKDAYQRTFAAWREALAERWVRVGASWHQLVTDEDPVQLVRRVVRRP